VGNAKKGERASAEASFSLQAVWKSSSAKTFVKVKQGTKIARQEKKKKRNQNKNNRTRKRMYLQCTMRE